MADQQDDVRMTVHVKWGEQHAEAEVSIGRDEWDRLDPEERRDAVRSMVSDEIHSHVDGWVVFDDPAEDPEANA